MDFVEWILSLIAFSCFLGGIAFLVWAGVSQSLIRLLVGIGLIFITKIIDMSLD